MAVIQPPPYQDASGSYRWAEWYRIINKILEDISTSLDGIDDVTLTSEGDKELLAYDSSSSKWINQTAAEAGLQTSGAILDDLNTLGQVTGDGDFLVGTAAGVFAWESGSTATASLGLDSDLSTFVLPANTTISSYGATLVDDADEATARTTLGLVAGGAGDIWVEKAGDTMTGALTISTTTATALQITSTDATATVGPSIVVYRNSASVAKGDVLGSLDFKGNIFGGVFSDRYYARIIAEVDDDAGGPFQLLRFQVSNGISSDRTRYVITHDAHIFTSDDGDDILTAFHDPEGTGVGILTVEGTSNAAAVDPILDLYANSAAPASDNYLIGVVTFSYINSATTKTTAASIGSKLLDVTDGTEDTLLYIQTSVAGTLTNRVFIENGLYMSGATGGDPGAGKINTSGYEIDGTAGVASFGPSAVTSITVQGGLITAIS